MLPIKSKKDIERLYLEIDQITHQNKKYILHIAQLQEDLEDLMNSICEKNKQLRTLNDKLSEEARLLSEVTGVKAMQGQIIRIQQMQIESILKLILKISPKY